MNWLNYFISAMFQNGRVNIFIGFSFLVAFLRPDVSLDFLFQLDYCVNNITWKHLGLVTPCGDIDLGKFWLRLWLVAWRHQAITAINVDLLPVKPSDIRVGVIPQPPITKIVWKITYIKLDFLSAVFQDVHVMIFIGFGFLMTFLKRYGFGAVSLNFLVASFVLQWAILMGGFLRMDGGKIALNITRYVLIATRWYSGSQDGYL